jgi:hypothetical protein
MVSNAGGPLIFNCRYTSFLIVVHHIILLSALSRGTIFVLILESDP